MKTDENNPEDWYRSGRIRLGSVDHLYPLEGSSESVIELLQESVERFLKGYLISKGWHLSKIHDLGALIAEAEKYGPRYDLISYEISRDCRGHFNFIHIPAVLKADFYLARTL